MLAWKNSSLVRAAPGDLFAYLDDPTRLPEWIPGMVEIRNVIGKGAGQQYEWSYKMAGILMRGQATVVDHVPGKSATHQTIGAIHAIWGFSLEPDVEGPMLTAEVEYHIPVPVIGRVAEHILLKLNEREFDLALVNVKEFMEGQAS